MREYCDFHIHSKYSSDGQHTVEEIAEMLKAENVKRAAITDHNKVEGTFEFLKSAHTYGIIPTTGVELSTRGKHHENIHLLLYHIKPNDDLQSDLDIINTQYHTLSQMRIAKLNEMGFTVTMDDVLNEEKIVPSMGPTIGAAVLHNKKNFNDPRLKKYRTMENGDYRFYVDYLRNKKSKAYIYFKEYSVYDALKLANKYSFIPVLAHPGYSLRHFDRTGKRDFIKDLIKYGLLGIEVYSSHHSKEDILFFKKICQKHNLKITGGSDFHGNITKPEITIKKYKIDCSLLDTI